MKITLLTPFSTMDFIWKPLFEILEPALLSHGLEPELVAWPDCPLEPAQPVCPLFAWGYHENRGDWQTILDLRGRHSATINDVATLRWNSSKTYLEDVSKRAATLPTCVVSEARELDLDEVRERLGARNLVAKPVVGACSYGVKRIPEDVRRLQVEATMLQPFMKSITSEGEISIILIDGRYSHAVRKLPAAGDFRVQLEYGGRAERVDVPDSLVRQALAAVTAAPAPPAYGRVDFILMGSDDWRVSEVELIEPDLYFEYQDSAPRDFAAALSAVFRARRS
jgi:glutathione synthase/RimK-type ligase-like ATP-grasp enzyme